MKNPVCFLVFFLLSFPASANDSMTSTIVLAYVEDAENSIIHEKAHLIYTEAFRRLGFRYEYRFYPTQRCSIASDTGAVDGESMRVAEYREAHPNLVMVEEPIFDMNWAAYSLNPDIRLTGWESLKGMDHMVDYRRGVRLSEVNLNRYVKKDRLQIVNKIRFGLHKLVKKRTDIFIDVEMFTDAELAKKEFADSGIKKICTMKGAPVYAFLHKKHMDLAPRLADVLRKMKEEGLMEKYDQMAAKMQK